MYRITAKIWISNTQHCARIAPPQCREVACGANDANLGLSTRKTCQKTAPTRNAVCNRPNPEPSVLIYRLIVSLAVPILALVALIKVLRGKMLLGDLCERLGAGLDRLPVPHGPVLWVHGASNGELTAARHVIEAALDRAPDLQIIVTVNSITARAMVRGWGLPRLHVRLAPLDLRRTVHRFIACAQPNALLTIENEIWPNRFTLCARHSIPVIVVGARMSEQTARIWQKYRRLLGRLTARTLDAISALAPQDAASEERLLALGLAPSRLLPRMNLKSGVEMATAVPADAATLRATFQKDETVLAASTHEGEDAVVLDAIAALRARSASARTKLILAPRHPARADAIEELARSMVPDLPLARRSRGDSPTGAAIYLADTLGEMPLWYALAGQTFVGGSLVDVGGHTPFEPAQFGTVILHGPYVANHAPAYTALHEADGAIEIATVQDLTEALATLIATPDEAQHIARKGAAALGDLKVSDTATQAFWAALDQAMSRRAAPKPKA